jgi:hypothetical protein
MPKTRAREEVTTSAPLFYILIGYGRPQRRPRTQYASGIQVAVTLKSPLFTMLMGL